MCNCTILSAKSCHVEIDAQHNGKAEDILSMGDWVEDVSFKISPRWDVIPASPTSPEEIPLSSESGSAV